MKFGFEAEVIRFPQLESTNTTIKELALSGKARERTVVLADTQTAGRGRGKHLWHSPRGGLYLSTLLYPAGGGQATDLALLSGLAVVLAVKELLPDVRGIGVKWPNDCLIDWKKVGGILCEDLGEAKKHLSIVGIGLNINTPEEELEPFRSNPFPATSLKRENKGIDLRAERVFAKVIESLFSVYEQYQATGFEHVLRLWEKNCPFVGKKVEMTENNVSQTGTFLGVDERGAVVLSTPQGGRQHFVSGELTCFWP